PGRCDLHGSPRRGARRDGPRGPHPGLRAPIVQPGPLAPPLHPV
ncbi:uncharacterized protein METZ01_LOCUS435995, partial [marine metagenome]